MRVLLVRPGPHFSVADVANGWAKGLRSNGVEVADFNFDERLSFYSLAHIPREEGGYRRALENPEDAARLAAKGLEAACYRFWPDVVLVVSGFYVPPDTLAMMRSRGHKVVLLHTESPYEDDRQLVRAEHVDLSILNDPTNIDQFRALGPAVFIPHAYDPEVHYPRPAVAEAASDFCFVGTGYPSRIRFLEQVDFTGIDVALAGNWKGVKGTPLAKYLAHDIGECCPNSEAAVLYASTKVSANLYRKEATADADGWAMGPREVELAACGTFQLRESRGEGDEVLHMLPTFDGPDDFEDQLRWWLAHDEVREDTARRARLAVADRTFHKNAARLLSLLSD